MFQPFKTYPIIILALLNPKHILFLCSLTVCPVSGLHWPNREPHPQHGTAGKGRAGWDPGPVPVLHEDQRHQTFTRTTSVHTARTAATDPDLTFSHPCLSLSLWISQLCGRALLPLLCLSLCHVALQALEGSRHHGQTGPVGPDLLLLQAFFCQGLSLPLPLSLSEHGLSLVASLKWTELDLCSDSLLDWRRKEGIS